MVAWWMPLGDNVLAEFASVVGKGGAQLRPDTIQEPLRGRAMDFQFDEKKLRFVKRVLNNRLLFKIALLFQVPMNFMTGMRLRELSEESCKVSVSFLS